MKHTLRALSQRNFRLYFMGQGASLVGTWMQQLALSWLVYRLTGSPFMLGLTNFVGQIPILFLAPFGGVWSDRIDRRRAMLLTQALSLVQAATLTVLAFGGWIEVWHLLCAAAFIGVVNAFDAPLRQSFLLELVGSREQLPNAIALNSLMMHSSRLIGPTLAGLMLALTSEAWCFLINAISYLAVLASLLAMRLAPTAPHKQTHHWLAGLIEALRFAFGFGPTRLLLGLVALMSFVATPYSTLLPVFARDILGGGAHTLGWLVASAGAGAVIGVVFLALRRGTAGLERVIAAAALLSSVGLLFFSRSQSLWLSLLLLPLIGFGTMSVAASVNTLIQLIASDGMRGRLVSLQVTAFLGVMPLGALAFGWLAEHIGAANTVTVGGVLCLLGAVWFALQLKRLGPLLAPHHAAN